MIRPGDLHRAEALSQGQTLSAPALSTRRLTGRRATILCPRGLADPGAADRSDGAATLAQRLQMAAEARGIADRLTVLGAPQTGTGPGSGAPAPGARRGLAAMRALLGGTGTDSILALGLDGGAALAGARALSARRLVLHLAGYDAAQAAASGPGRAARRWSAARAISAADALVADNAALAAEVAARHGKRPRVIAYGAEPAGARGAGGPLAARPADLSDLRLPDSYALAIARPEPAAQLHLLLHAFSRLGDLPLVLACDWSATRHARQVRAAWDGAPNVHLIDAPRDAPRLHALRSGAWLHLHGQSGGGATQDLVEAMGYGAPILTSDCAQARATTAGTAETFADARGLVDLVRRYAAQPGLCLIKGATHGAVARRRYRWDDVVEAYFELLDL
jgi:glycosyltransferase involved in cell wall biosynthesis